MNFKSFTMEELSSVCLPDEMKQGTYYQQGDDIVLKAESCAQEEHGSMTIRFSNGKTEHATALENVPLIPLTGLELRFQLFGGVRRIKLERWALIDSYQNSFLLLVDGVLHIMLSGNYGGSDRPENRDQMYRMALNLKNQIVERISPDQMFLVFEQAIMCCHCRDGDVDVSRQMAELKFSEDDWGRCT